MISGQKHIYSGQSGTKDAVRHRLQAMRCAPWCELLSLLHMQSVGPSPCTAPALWPERLSADCSWSPWWSKWNHMGEPDSGAWPEEKLTWAVRQAVSVLWDGWSLLQGLTLRRIHSNAHTQYYHIHALCTLNGMPEQTLSLIPPPPAVYTAHSSSILSGVFCGWSALRSGQPIRSIYRRASRHVNNTKHTNGRETKPQATDIQ